MITEITVIVNLARQYSESNTKAVCKLAAIGLQMSAKIALWCVQMHGKNPVKALRQHCNKFVGVVDFQHSFLWPSVTALPIISSCSLHFHGIPMQQSFVTTVQSRCGTKWRFWKPASSKYNHNAFHPVLIEVFCFLLSILCPTWVVYAIYTIYWSLPWLDDWLLNERLAEWLFTDRLIDRQIGWLHLESS